MRFNEIFLELRKENNLTQLDISKKLGFAKNTICAWEKGRAQPNFETLIALAKLFNVSPNYLLGFEDDFGNVSVSSSQSDLSKDEKTLLERFRKLGPFERESILVQIDALSSEEYNARVYGAKPLIKK